MLIVDSVSKYFGQRVILDRLTFVVPKGTVVGVLGLNGAGKSTLLKGLASVLSFDSGQVEIFGHSLRQQPSSYRTVVGYQPETPPLSPMLSVKEHFLFFGALRSMKGAMLNERLSFLFSKLQLGHLQHSPCGELSLGERQRVAFGLACFHSPQLLLLDEPTRGLDPCQLRLFQELLTLEREQRITIFSTHQLSEAQYLCDVVLLLEHGRVEVIERGMGEKFFARLRRYFAVDALEIEEPSSRSSLFGSSAEC